MEEVKIGDIIKGQITGVENYGAFVSINSEYSGLIHISEISDGFVKDINDFISIGDTIYCKVVEIDQEAGKLKLSIKNLNYKADQENFDFKETVRGFSILKDNLDAWLQEKKSEIEEKEEKN